MTISDIAIELNKLSKNYNIGKLQLLRKAYKHLSKAATYDIFNNSSIDVNGLWAFHVGGRKEIQFNIGFEDNKIFRYGLAFSLEASQGLPNPIEVLSPKIQLFNDYLKEYPSEHKSYSMWHFYDGIRSSDFPINPIPYEWIKRGTFIFIGKYIKKSPEEITEKDLNEVLKTFDELLNVYEYIERVPTQTSNEVIEDKIARICWNDFNWQRPSGADSKSKNEDCHEAKEGYGHEEWLLDMNKIIDGYHYGFIQCFNNKKDFSGSVFDLSLFTINGKTGQRFWVGEIKSLEVITTDDSVVLSNEYENRGWKKEMADQLKAVNINPSLFIKTPDEIFANVRFKQENLNLLEKPLEFSNKDQAVTSTYYSTLLNKKQDPQLLIPVFAPFTFNPGHTEGKESTTAEYGKRKGDVDLAHNKMQTHVYNQLVKEHGKDNVGTEQNSIGGTKIDLILKKSDKFWFYEFKTFNSIKTCIREALPQLLEYTYWHKKDNVDRLIIVSQNPITPDADNYLKLLREKFNISLYYQRYDPELLKLENEFF